MADSKDETEPQEEDTWNEEDDVEVFTDDDETDEYYLEDELQNPTQEEKELRFSQEEKEEEDEEKKLAPSFLSSTTRENLGLGPGKNKPVEKSESFEPQSIIFSKGVLNKLKARLKKRRKKEREMLLDSTLKEKLDEKRQEAQIRQRAVENKKMRNFLKNLKSDENKIRPTHFKTGYNKYLVDIRAKLAPKNPIIIDPDASEEERKEILQREKEERARKYNEINELAANEWQTNKKLRDYYTLLGFGEDKKASHYRKDFIKTISEFSTIDPNKTKGVNYYRKFIKDFLNNQVRDYLSFYEFWKSNQDIEIQEEIAKIEAIIDLGEKDFNSDDYVKPAVTEYENILRRQREWFAEKRNKILRGAQKRKTKKLIEALEAGKLPKSEDISKKEIGDETHPLVISEMWKVKKALDRGELKLPDKILEKFSNDPAGKFLTKYAILKVKKRLGHQLGLTKEEQKGKPIEEMSKRAMGLRYASRIGLSKRDVMKMSIDEIVKKISKNVVMEDTTNPIVYKEISNIQQLMKAKKLIPPPSVISAPTKEKRHRAFLYFAIRRVRREITNELRRKKKLSLNEINLMSIDDMIQALSTSSDVEEEKSTIRKKPRDRGMKFLDVRAINNIIKGNITDATKKFASKELLNSLRSLSDQYHKKYANTVTENISKNLIDKGLNENGKLFSQTALITIFLKSSYTSKFKDDVKSNKIDDDSLNLIPIEDKYPYFYDSANEKERTDYQSYILNFAHAEEWNIAVRYYRSIDPTRRISGMIKTITHPKIEEPIEEPETKDIPPEQDSDSDLSDKDNEIIQECFYGNLPEKLVEQLKDEQHVIPNLWNSVITNINSTIIESNKQQAPEIPKSFSPAKIEEKDETSSEDLTISIDSTEQEPELEREKSGFSFGEEKEKEEKSDEQKIEDEMKKNPLYNCDKCGKTVSDPQFKTMVIKDGNPKEIIFCSVKCFEDQEKLFKKKKNKKVEKNESEKSENEQHNKEGKSTENVKSIGKENVKENVKENTKEQPKNLMNNKREANSNKENGE